MSTLAEARSDVEHLADTVADIINELGRHQTAVRAALEYFRLARESESDTMKLLHLSHAELELKALVSP